MIAREFLEGLHPGADVRSKMATLGYPPTFGQIQILHHCWFDTICIHICIYIYTYTYLYIYTHNCVNYVYIYIYMIPSLAASRLYHIYIAHSISMMSSLYHDCCCFLNLYRNVQLFLRRCMAGNHQVCRPSRVRFVYLKLCAWFSGSRCLSERTGV